MLKVSANLVNGDLYEGFAPESVIFELQRLRIDGLEGKSLVHALLTDDWGPPPHGVRISGTMADGTPVDEYIPYT